MSKRGAGISFIFIGTILLTSNYISAAIFGSSVTSWDEELYKAIKKSIGHTLINLSILFYILGFIYLVIAEIQSFKNNK